MFAGLLLQVGIGFAYGSDWEEKGQRIQEAVEHFASIPVSKLIEAAEKGNLEDVKSALNSLKTNINDLDKYNTTALMYAARSGRKDIVELLVVNGADPHIITWNDKTALREAVKGGHKEIIKLLLDVNSKFRERSIDYALVEACSKGEEDSVNLLLDRGANPNAKACSSDPNGPPIETTPLIQAVIKGGKDMVRLLLDKGANPNIKDGYGYTAEQIAKSKGYKDIVQLMENYK